MRDLKVKTSGKLVNKGVSARGDVTFYITYIPNNAAGKLTKYIKKIKTLGRISIPD